jgi:hypothetical protein
MHILEPHILHPEEGVIVWLVSCHIHITSRRQNPEDGDLNYRHEDLKSRLMYLIFK